MQFPRNEKEFNIINEILFIKMRSGYFVISLLISFLYVIITQIFKKYLFGYIYDNK